MNRPGENKPPLRRVLVYAIWEALTWQRGAEKHGEDDWRREEIPASEYVDAIVRHAERIESGELIDPESGLPHAAHIVVDAKIYGVKTEDEAAKQLAALAKREPIDGTPVELKDLMGGGK